VPALSPHRLASLLPVFLGVIICAVLAGSRLRLHSAPALRYATAAALLRVRRSSPLELIACCDATSIPLAREIIRWNVIISMKLRIALFTLATEVFREQADKDYIVARSSYRMNLREQFLWASLQACEKYLKGILLFNERSARYDPASYDPIKKRNKEFGHDSTRLFAAARTIADLPLDKPDWLPDFLKYLAAFGNNRYLSKATYATGDELRRLDEAVWVLRRACQNFDWTANVNGSPKNLRPALVAQSNRPEHRKTPALYRPFGAIGGYLEKILKASNSDPARQALVWKNMFFGNRQRHRVTYTQFSSSENPPQTREWFLDPTITSQIDYYIRLT
jgi:hypothetical protein